MEDMISTNCIDCDLKCDIFKHLSENELNLVNKNRFETNYRAGDTIIKQGSPISYVAFLVSGFAKIYIEGNSGKELVHAISKPVTMLNGPGLYYGEVSRYSVSALSNMKVCYINKNDFKSLVFNNRDFSDGFIKEFSRRATNTLNRFYELSQKKAIGRVADGLLYLSRTIFKEKSFDALLSRQELADFTVTSKACMIRILKTFKDDGIIKSNGNEFEILDIDMLEKVSRFG
ncbi:MAG: Crp/Fnr family transcriptional regulator [Bacteroidetes bacterium]|jgi:CRP/FNR family transcriptional regulator, polysaccharide utilization system transcription regulator|nr:Crp/Fnr family transcriptional regulator [Bacteroidota bacterium]MBT6685969.1 Crp/Fnr family transcriptional regulator [Bacteroidota bacterium]MBT7144431.1 Crp/Fnr family transcriptional regulator [Bacteroidota bacterium]MBT7490850.1 Crp/Fnr family transcriptional regulator [Bacteroidota bacterium]